MTEIRELPSNPARGPIATLLAESFELLARGLPQAHTRMLACLQGGEVELVLDGEPIHLRFGLDDIELSSTHEPDSGCPRIECSLAAIVAVLDARLTLAEAVESDAVRVRADLDRLVHLHDGLLAYVHGAVRCPGFPALLVRLRVLAHRDP